MLDDALEIQECLMYCELPSEGRIVRANFLDTVH